MAFEITIWAAYEPTFEVVEGGTITSTEVSPDVWSCTSPDDITYFRFDVHYASQWVTKIEIVSENLTSLDRTFESLYLLTEFVVYGPTVFSSVANFDRAWASCTGLTTFPIISVSGSTTLNSTWAYCSGLTDFPVIDTSTVVSLYNTWANCTGLTNFPLIDTSNVTDFTSTWHTCSALTQFPSIDTSNGTSFTRSWQECNSITSLPVLDLSSSNGDFSYTWYKCSSLTEFPKMIFPASPSNFTSAWAYCSAIEAFLNRELLVSGGIDIWRDCTSLKCIPAIDSSTSYYPLDNAFTNCPSLCRPNPEEQAEIISGSNWESGVPEGEDCCTWVGPVINAYVGSIGVDRMYLGADGVDSIMVGDN